MERVELLSPAGNMECLISAVQNGADAVYVGGKKFGARAFANNFDYDELVEAIKYCHLYGVKIYVTVNTICYENELEEVLKYIEFLHTNHVDALIMQDLGLIKLVREKFPNLEIHASTQMHNHNDAGLSILKELGIKRVVLDREMSLDEINNLKTDIEKEVFIHGALCVSYSGCCLFSAMHGGRSGNRGECVGACRLPYKLLENGKEVNTDGEYILSTKSLCTINNINKILSSNITSLKIEGRMKSKEYVGYITRLYREKIDEYYLSKNYNITDEEIKNIKKLYNRELTSGYLFNNYGSSIMNIKTSNHIGVVLGNVIRVDSKKIYISLKDEINQEDGIRFDNDKGMIVNKLYNQKNMLVNHLNKGDIAILDNKIGLTKGSIVRKTIDSKLVEDINKYKERKVLIGIYLEAKVGKKLELSITDGVNKVELLGNVVESAKNSPTTEERIKEQIEKLGNTIFISSDTKLDLDNNIFLSIKELNDIRRVATDKLKDLRENNSKTDIIINDIELIKHKNDNRDLIISILVRNEEQLKASIKNNINYIYTDNFDLYKKYKKNNVYYKTPRVSLNNIDYKDENLLVTELGGVYKYSKDNKVNTDYYLNVVNSSTTNFIHDLGVNRVTLSPELDIEDYKYLSSKNNIDVLVYGRVELMITKYCPMNMIINKDKKECSLCYKNKYSLKDKDNNIYPIVTNNHLVTILDSNNINMLDDINKLMNYDIYSYRIDLYDEKEKDIDNIINKIRESYERRNNKKVR